MIDLSSDSEDEVATQKGAKTNPVVSQSAADKKAAQIRQELTERDHVSAESVQFEEQVALLGRLKLNSSHAKLCKICITCWRLILVSECSGPQTTHKDHVITGTFD